jgi:sigma-54-specific transcriptional regulator
MTRLRNGMRRTPAARSTWIAITHDKHMPEEPALTRTPPTSDKRPVLVHPQAQSNVLSVRAKALVFADPLSQLLLQQIQQVAQSEASVLLVGETGTGKELLAHHLHRESLRSGQFVAVNCGALSPTLAEAEFFGHQAGSFTGATETRAGWFEEADGGTLFLDEISDLPLPVQGKLLRVLQEREVVRVGSRRSIRLDFRLVAATNIDLQKAVAAGTFRRDLYYRLSVMSFNVPTLHQRPADILPLATHFLELYSRRLTVARPQLTAAAEEALLRYSWPGNIRELENVMHAAVLMAGDSRIDASDLRFSPFAEGPPPAGDADAWSLLTRAIDQLLASGEPGLHQRLEELIVRRAFAQAASNQVRTAGLLGVSRNVVRTLLRRVGLVDARA